MLFDDIIYAGLLLLCIGFGKFYRHIEPVQLKQWVGTAVGLGLVTLVSGKHALHPIITTLVTAIIVTKLPPKISHLVTIYFTFFYLLVIFRLSAWFGMRAPSGHSNLIQMMLTLKLSGLAFEINSAATASLDNDIQGVSSTALARIRFLDVVHYAFSYIGVLTGPYYRYRTYWDSLHRPFALKADHWKYTYPKLIQTVFFILIFLSSNYFFPAKYTLTDEFAERSFFYRFWYIYPTFVTFRMRMYIGMILSECVCQMAGLGAYPSKCEPAPGLGPKDYKGAIALLSDEKSLKSEDIDFETVHNMNVWSVETSHIVRDVMKKWNSCVQYWMAVCIYKRFPHKGLRIAATLAISALWHGYAPGYYICICQVTLFLPMEDIYVKFYKASEEGSLIRKGLHCLLYFTRISCMAYLGLSFQLLDFYETWTFYKRVYFAGHIIVITLYIIGRCLQPYVLEPDKKRK